MMIDIEEIKMPIESESNKVRQDQVHPSKKKKILGVILLLANINMDKN